MSWNALIIGLGQIGMGYDLDLPQDAFVYSHARTLHLHPQFNLVGAVDTGARERDTFQKLYHAPAYASIEEALKYHAPDLIIIAAPTALHCELTLRVLNLCTPRMILCEKPLSYSLAESRKILDLCVEKNVRLYVNYMRRSEPGALEVKRRIDCGGIAGPVKGIAWYSKGFLHNGSHFFNLLEYWLGAAKEFGLINSGRALPDGDAEPDVRVTFEKGEVVFLAAKDENFSHNAIELIAQNGRLRYENGGRHIEWRSVGIDENLKAYTFLTESPEEIPSELNRYQWHVAEQMANALMGSEAYLCEGSQGVQTLKTMNSILESRQ